MWVPFYWFAVALLTTTPSFADGISGPYVGSGSNSAFLVEIVETAGGQLTGRYEQTALQPDGKIDQKTASITGASDGQTIVVTIKPNTDQLFVSNITASGTIQGTMLHLSGGEGDGSKIDLNLAKSDEVAYQTEIAKLKLRAQVVNDARSRAIQLIKLTQWTAALIAATGAASADLPKFQPIEDKYRAVTEWMSAALSRQRSIYTAGQASVTSGQIGVAINQAGVAAEQLHTGFQNSGQDAATKIQQAGQAVVNFTKLSSLSIGGNKE